MVSLDAPSLDQAPNLLPLLKADPKVLNAKEPPLHLYPRNYSPGIESRRIMTTIKSSSSSKREEIETNWISTTHLFPGAYPRSHPNSTSPPSKSGQNGKYSSGLKVINDKEEAKKQRGKDLKDFADIWKQEENSLDSLYPITAQDGGSDKEETLKEEAEKLKNLNCPQLWSCVERIVPIESQNVEGQIDRNDGEGVTLIFAHANGFHKEIWEPTIEEILSSLSKASQSSNEPMPRIDEIWCIDSVNSGEAGALNRETLGDVVSWFDYPRDISQLLNHFIPPKPSFREVTEETIETQAASYPFPPKKKKVIKKKLVLTPDGRSSSGIHWPGAQLNRTREGEGRKGRRFVGIGHSFGGACLAMLSNAEPDLFEAVILLDPVMRPPDGFSRFSNLEVTRHPSTVPLAIGAVSRKDCWSTRAEAVQSFNSKPFFKSWDPRVLSKHLQFGLRPISSTSSSNESENGPCTLSCNKWHEASAFATSLLGSWGFSSLKSGKFNGNYYIITMKDGDIYGKDEEVAREVREAPGRGSESGEMLDGGHLVAQEQPVLLGAKIVSILPKLLSGKGSNSGSQTAIPRPKL